MTTSDTKKTSEQLVVGAVASLRAAKDTSFYRLKRGTEILDAMLEPVFHNTKKQLHANSLFIKDDLLAVALLLLARLADTPGNAHLAHALSSHKYSEVRFRSLMRCVDAGELFTHLQRASKYCDDKICPFDLTRIVLGWHESLLPALRKRLSAEFFSFEEPASA